MYASPIYNMFMNEAYEMVDKVEMIHPAHFVFNAGGTPKAWNQKKLSDPHLKFLYYNANSSAIFPNTDIKGGVAITYCDKKQNFGSIEIYTLDDKLNSILQRVKNMRILQSFIILYIIVNFTNFVFNNKELWENKKVFVIATMGLFSGDGAGSLGGLLR